MINEIPKTTRYEKIMKTVYDFLISEQIEFFPIDPIYIINKNKWGLITYSELAKTHQVSIQDIIKAYQSEDGYVILDSNNYTIAYNDTIKSKERIRFTLMHEIGHIKLNHLEDFDETILLRSNLTKQQYDVLEREAHAFARNTLAPAIVVRKLESLRNKPITFFDIKSNFFVSKKASEIRMTMLEWDTKHSTNYENT